MRRWSRDCDKVCLSRALTTLQGGQLTIFVAIMRFPGFWGHVLAAILNCCNILGSSNRLRLFKYVCSKITHMKPNGT
jgi:hypothetical protein